MTQDYRYSWWLWGKMPLEKPLINEYENRILTLPLRALGCIACQFPQIVAMDKCSVANPILYPNLSTENCIFIPSVLNPYLLLCSFHPTPLHEYPTSEQLLENHLRLLSLVNISVFAHTNGTLHGCRMDHVMQLLK